MLAWTCRAFQELTPGELYDLLQLRIAVFCVEQNCVYQDADGLDPTAWHLSGRDAEHTLQAYARLVPGGGRFENPSIGRVVTSQAVRRTGCGRALMRQSIQECERLFGEGSIEISAQAYLERFYGELGFVREGESYIEDGIPHLHMVRPMGGGQSNKR